MKVPATVFVLAFAFSPALCKAKDATSRFTFASGPEAPTQGNEMHSIAPSTKAKQR
jgi:hypothetical protein